MADNRPIQHTPKHLDDSVEVFDRRHPAASSFAPLQPAAGVVADDVEERGQNLAGGPTASEAHAANLDQTEKLLEQHRESLRTAAPNTPPEPQTAQQAADAQAAKDAASKSSAKSKDK